MSHRRSPLPVQVLLFLLVTLLGIATGNLTNSTGALPWAWSSFGGNRCPWPLSPCCLSSG